MAQIEVLQKMLIDMETQINKLNEYIHEKEDFIDYTNKRIDELNQNLIKEQEALETAAKKREKMLEMQNEVLSNFNQINESVNTLVDILKTKDFS